MYKQPAVHEAAVVAFAMVVTRGGWKLVISDARDRAINAT